ncbi:MAG: thioredoxin family protein, partial [Nanoarchaeota archaeon]|nr:thioredoxin family protein [Nanoarchaeota archaeon]
MKKLIYSLMILFIFLLSLNFVAADNQVDLYNFHGKGCQHCAQLLEFIDSIKDDYPNLNFVEFEVYFNDENRDLFERMSLAYDTEIQGVPTTFIDKQVHAGFTDSLKEVLIKDIERCSVEECVSPKDILNNFVPKPNIDPKELTIPAVILA